MLLGSGRTLTYPTEATTVLAFRERTPDAPRPPRLLEEDGWRLART